MIKNINKSIEYLDQRTLRLTKIVIRGKERQPLEKAVETYLNATHANDEEQLNHEESCQEIHKGRACQASQIREQAETERTFSSLVPSSR